MNYFDLTDWDAYECFKLAFGYCAKTCRNHGINRDEAEGKIEVYAYPNDESIKRVDLSIWQDGKMAATGFTHRSSIFSPVWDAIEVVRYLHKLAN